MQAHVECEASIGAEAYRNEWLREGWVAWNLTRKREAEQERARRRKVREARWAAIQAGKLKAFSIFDAEVRSSLDAPTSEVTLLDALRETSRERRRREEDLTQREELTFAAVPGG